ncbi:DUF2029 domain-containing protein [Nocardia panacis]|uniref:DUF2029 domain-containing protein n=1 Tax=Nocardia panacis TaxID=2340916 RepID=A0A3A4K0B7_9NOCA|nr:glycosyltransferase 87 family protein [Nocardia panacis]RJO77275.1 DUF2029 domain-containing protein [Nocardia panacis]
MVLLFTTVDPWMNRAGILAGGLDVHVYRDGALKVLRGNPLYTEESIFGLFYTYTPFSTLAFLPIAAVPWSLVTNTALILNLLILFACVLLCWRILGYRIDGRLVLLSALLALMCTFLEPVRTTLFYGQINLLLMALVLWDFARSPGSRLRGLGVGLAAGIKLVPLFYVTQFAVLRQWRAAATAVVTFAGSVALAWLVLPADSREYWTDTFFQSTRIAPDGHPANQSIRGALAHLARQQQAQVWLWLLIAIPVAVLSLFVAAALYRRGERLLAVTVSGMAACTVSPFSWSHHWVWFVPLFVYLVHRATRQSWWWVVIAGLYAAQGAWTWRWSPDWVVVGLYMFPPTWSVAPLLMNGCILVFAGVLIGSCVLLRRQPRTLPREDARLPS